MRASIAAVSAVLVLAGCGGSGGDTTTGDAAKESYATAAALAEATGCQGYELNTDGQMFVKELGSCQLDGVDLYVHVFNDNETRDQWLELAKAAGGSFGVGDKWAVQSTDAAVTKKAAEAAGGEAQ